MTSQGQAVWKTDKAAGVVLLQIAGLSRHQLRNVFDAGRFPCMGRLPCRLLYRCRTARELQEREWGVRG